MLAVAKVQVGLLAGQRESYVTHKEEYPEPLY
jgi:hypothetical protein